MERSQIRNSELNQLLDKVDNNNYNKYLKEIQIQKLRGIQNQHISFDFPVTALIGLNGSGKSTILGAAALLYKSQQPKKYFPKGGDADAGMTEWSASYKFIDRNLRSNGNPIIERSANFKRARWNRDAVQRNVLHFGVNRTVPIIEKKEFSKFAKSNAEYNKSPLNKDIVQNTARIISKNSKYEVLDAKGAKIHAGKDDAEIAYSEFNFGAGEASVLRMLNMIKDSEENALVLIEEIENGLHPIATKKLVEYLIRQAIEKKIQVVFTTHSQAAIEFLPEKAIWAIINGQAKQGVLDVDALYALEGHVEKDYVIYCEDEFSRTWIERMVVREDSLSRRTEVHNVGGDSIAVALHKSNLNNPAASRRFKSVCLVDGDSSHMADEENGVFSLPGEYPEFTVFDEIMDNWSSLGLKLQIGLTGNSENSNTQTTENELRSCRHECTDHHLLFSMIGNRFISNKEHVESAFINCWVDHFKDKVADFNQKMLSVFD